MAGVAEHVVDAVRLARDENVRREAAELREDASPFWVEALRRFGYSVTRVRLTGAARPQSLLAGELVAQGRHLGAGFVGYDGGDAVEAREQP